MNLNNDFQFIDLGLRSGIKWTNKNLGAESPQDVGLYYEYLGETVEKIIIDYDKYDNTSRNSILIPKQFDPASKLLGDNYITPTYFLWEELFENCTAKYSKQDNGIYLKSCKNNNSIFFPQDGYIGKYCNICCYATSNCAGLLSRYVVQMYENELSKLWMYKWYGALVRPISI